MADFGKTPYFSVIFIRPPEQRYFPEPVCRIHASPEVFHPAGHPTGIPRYHAPVLHGRRASGDLTHDGIEYLRTSC
ncbi:hypothetical protein [Novacetimonas pomaceti]|uniref:hypothetical protein n=1 Tax=Novacetimonas pomaceti TaxID=2021998 RepID=UPI000D7C8743|nr:hypothetical protein [Novacetimonas pomaceti]